VSWADWTPDGSDLAIARENAQNVRLEFPAGRIIYQPQGWVSHLRFSRSGDHIAFADHVTLGDDGRVVIVDREGNRKVSSSFYTTIEGLAWSADGKEVWFTASPSGAARAIYAMDMSGKQRLVLRVPGTLTLQDITRDGRVLLCVDSAQFGIFGLSEGETVERNLSWFDWSGAASISADNKNLILFESGEGVGARYAVFMRGMDGSPAVRLGDGTFPRLSPDGKWVAALTVSTPNEIELLPTGAGAPRQLTNDSLEHDRVEWAPGGKALVFTGGVPNRPPRTYLLDLETKQQKAITPEGITGVLISPDSKLLLAFDSDRKGWLYPLDGGQPQALQAAVDPEDFVIEWGADSKSLLVQAHGIPAKIFRVELGTTRRELVRQISPSDPAGIATMVGVIFSPDHKAYAYSYYRLLSDLYVVDGLK
jgi:eukaryotic-like serine/threonine-protein kinase